MSSPAPTSGRDGATDSGASHVTVGVTGLPVRSDVSSWGAVTPWGDDGVALDWFVAAEDRWHVPGNEPTVRRRRLDGAPVVETRVRVPDGDAVQRVWSVPDQGGLTVVEVENDSPLAFAVAFAGRPVLTEREPTVVPIEGIELPEGAIVLPVGHRSSVRVAIPHGPSQPTASRAGLRAVPAPLAVARGWTSVVERASRLVLPDEALVEAVVSARCDLLLLGPVEASDDPVGFVLDVAELVRCGDDATAWLPEIVDPLERATRAGGVELAAALDAAAVVARRAADDRASRDIERLRNRVAAVDVPAPSGFADVRRGASVGRFVRSVERCLADGGRLLPAGLPSGWLGSNFEVHHVPTAGGSDVSFALRWHGERPAVLWEQRGEPVALTAPAVDLAWTSSATTGEALWDAPTPARRGLDVQAEPGSFG